MINDKYLEQLKEVLHNCKCTQEEIEIICGFVIGILNRKNTSLKLY